MKDEKDPKKQNEKELEPKKPKELKPTSKKKAAEEDEDNQNWDDFEEITKGNFNKLLGCG